MPTTLSFDDADARFDLRKLLPAYDESEEVHVLDSGTHKAEDIDLDSHSYVAAGDIAIEGNLCASEDGGFLVVQGDMQVGNLLIGGPMVYVGGSLTAEHAIHTDYNHGMLVVMGDVSARVIAAEHVFLVKGALRCATTIDFGGFRVADEGFEPTLTRDQAARESSSYLVPEVLNDQGYVDGGALSDYLANGGNPVLNRPVD